jgi:hypothetical protein
MFLVLYGLLLAYLAFAHPRPAPRTVRLAYTAVLTMMLVFSSWPFNWLAWLVPLLAWAVVQDDLPDVLYAFIGLYFAAYLSAWGKPIGGYTFYPLAQVLRYFTPFRELVSPYLPFERAQGWLFAAFVASTVSMLALAVHPTRSTRAQRWSLGTWSALAPSLLLAALVLVTTWVGSRDFALLAQEQTSGDPLPLRGETSITQTLETGADGLHALEVWVGAPLPKPDSGQLLVGLQSGAAAFEPLSLQTKVQQPNAMHRLSLPELYPAGTYTLTLEWTGAGTLMVGRSQGNALPNGLLRVEGASTQGDLAFRALGTVNWTDLAQSAWQRLADDWGFTLVWILLTVVAFAAASWLFAAQARSISAARAEPRGRS